MNDQVEKELLARARRIETRLSSMMEQLKLSVVSKDVTFGEPMYEGEGCSPTMVITSPSVTMRQMIHAMNSKDIDAVTFLYMDQEIYVELPTGWVV
jgi:hypothetical protein